MVQDFERVYKYDPPGSFLPPLTESSPLDSTQGVSVSENLTKATDALRAELRILTSMLSFYRPINLLPTPRFGQQVTANSSLLEGLVSPRHAPALFRIYCAFSTSGTLTAVRTIPESSFPNTKSTENLNGIAGALLSNTAYIFDVLMDEREKLDLTYSATTTIQKLAVWELDFLSG